MKQLNPDGNKQVIRDIDEAGALTKWLKGSRDELLAFLVGAPLEDVQGIQGQVKTIDQILAKATDLQ